MVFKNKIYVIHCLCLTSAYFLITCLLHRKWGNLPHLDYIRNILFIGKYKIQKSLKNGHHSKTGTVNILLLFLVILIHVYFFLHMYMYS